MTDNKSPAMPWYVRDHAADEPVQLMTLAQEGAYRRLLDHQWLHGSIPHDLKAIARVCKNVSTAEMKRIWSAIEGQFTPVQGQPTRLQNRRLERVRAEREAYRQKQRESGSRGAQVRWDREKGSKGMVDGEPIGGPTDKPTDNPSGNPTGEPIESPMADSCLAVASALAVGSEGVTHPPAGAALEHTDSEPPHTRTSVLALVIRRLYLGRRPSEPEMATNASILTKFNRVGYSWETLMRVVEGLARRRDLGELQSVARNASVSLKWLNDADQDLNQLAVSEDAFYRAGRGPSGDRSGSVTPIRSLVGRST